MAASKFVRRLCQDESLPNNEHFNIQIFISGLWDLKGGYHSPTQMKTALNISGADAAAFDLLISKLNSAPTSEEKSDRIRRFESILSKFFQSDNEGFSLASYDTPEDVEAWLLEVDNPPFAGG